MTSECHPGALRDRTGLPAPGERAAGGALAARRCRRGRVSSRRRASWRRCTMHCTRSFLRAPGLPPAPPSGQGGRDRRRNPGRAPPDAPRRRVWGGFELDLGHALPLIARTVVVRGRHDVPGEPPGHRGRRGRGRRGGRARRRRTRGCRAGSSGTLGSFDVYRGEQVGEGRKSVAIHLSFQSPSVRSRTRRRPSYGAGS